MIIIDTIKNMSDERFLAIYEGLSDRGSGPLDGAVAKAMKFRPQAIRKLAFDKRARKARQIILATNNAEISYELCGGYLMRAHEKLMPVTAEIDAFQLDIPWELFGPSRGRSPRIAHTLG